MPCIRNLQALEILDSRGRPTIEVDCELASGARASAQVPSGASTGQAEARELRDADPDRYAGLGCLQAVANVQGTILSALRDRQFASQVELDQALLDLDGTPDKAALGANAILGVSLAFARAHARELDRPLYQHFADMIDLPLQTLPRLTINLFSGGKHAGGQVPIQDVLIVPGAANSIADGLEQSCSVYNAAAQLMMQNYNMRKLTADEGGLAPNFASIESMFRDAIAAIDQAGLNNRVQLALDIAASHFLAGDTYDLGSEKVKAPGLIEKISAWVEDYPIVSVEDGLAEEDWSHWPSLQQTLAGRALTLGDDFLCTNPDRIQRAVDAGACDALLLKVNQIGTLTEAATALACARQANWKVTISARSGETEDNWLADLAVGWGADQIKVGSVNQSERLAKYNRLLAIERETGLPVVSWPD